MPASSKLTLQYLFPTKITEVIHSSVVRAFKTHLPSTQSTKSHTLVPQTRLSSIWHSIVGANLTLREGGVHSTMRLGLWISLVITASSLMSGKLKCDTKCAACWKDGDLNGADTKMHCKSCKGTCPSGYSRMHCAKEARC